MPRTHQAVDKKYMGTPAIKKLRCYIIVSSHTGSKIVTDTVKFDHHVITVPKVMPADRILEATHALSRALKKTTY